MKTSIQIKSIFGKIIFEFQKENNSIKENKDREGISISLNTGHNS